MNGPSRKKPLFGWTSYTSPHLANEVMDSYNSPLCLIPQAQRLHSVKTNMKKSIIRIIPVAAGARQPIRFGPITLLPGRATVDFLVPGLPPPAPGSRRVAFSVEQLRADVNDAPHRP